MQLHQEPIDLLVAGINNGANAGINVYYSGTVAAAMEGAFLKIPSVAMSVATEEDANMDFETAAQYCMQILNSLMPIKCDGVININIPRLSRGAPQGVKVVPQSTKGFDEFYVPKKNEQGQIVFQLSGGPHRTENITTDMTALVEGFITITPLAPGMTNHAKIKELQKINFPKTEDQNG
jgi:5'-nucleotidase